MENKTEEIKATQRSKNLICNNNVTKKKRISYFTMFQFQEIPVSFSIRKKHFYFIFLNPNF